MFGGMRGRMRFFCIRRIMRFDVGWMGKGGEGFGGRGGEGVEGSVFRGYIDPHCHGVGWNGKELNGIEWNGTSRPPPRGQWEEMLWMH